MRRDKGRMTFGLKALFSIAPLLLFLAPSIAAEVTYKDYTEARSEIWKRGFVFAISQYMMTVAQPGEETFSMTKDCPRIVPICSVTTRATTSLGPPAGNGTTTVIGLVG